ncbi:hypothetical protein RE6C_04638 [Rhodopirellula europaea 6C]|uniref:Uncharacterized protein n=1 Tax=Rhodopirellula europaea 6C TaxID=1263867 RepID=M2AXB9_9BACT|nr:hypothetical protein RE6C_04638 [Rhodopirellula europaea 6C]
MRNATLRSTVDANFERPSGHRGERSFVLVAERFICSWQRHSSLCV